MSSAARILVVDDEIGIREGCRRVLAPEGHRVDDAEDGAVGLKKLRAGTYDLALIDMMMPGIGGLELIETVHALDPEIVLVVITGFATIESTVEAMKAGAYDYLPKPFTPEALIAVVQRGLEKRALSLETRTLREERENRLLELAGEKSRTRTIIGCMADGVLVTNREGRLVLWNAAAAKMLQLINTAIPDRPIEHYVSNSDLLALLGEGLGGDFSMVRREIETGKGGAALMASVAPVRDEKGEILGAVTVLSDITELKEIDKVKSQFVSMVAHELRAPLAAVEGWLDLLLSGRLCENSDQALKYIERAKGRAHDLLELVNDLLAISRMDAGKVAQNMEPLDLAEVVTGVVEFLTGEAEEAGLTMTLTLPADLPRVRGDRKDVARIFTNLIDNAIKYNRPGGSITITGAVEQHYVCIRVADTGLGISESALPRIFDEFYRSEEEATQDIRGTGLGLAICQKIVDSHHGRIEVQSKLGVGSTFAVYLPREQKTHGT